jgi:hypothetical protein
MLPTHSGNRNNKGLNGIGTVNWIVVGSICWVVTSIVVIILGFRHCSNHARSVNFSCNNDICTFNQVLYSGGTRNIITMDRKDIRSIDLVRIDRKGTISEIQEDDNKGRRKYARLGQTLRLKAMVAPEPDSRIKAEKVFIFSSFDMGRQSKTYYNRIKRYIDKEGNEKIKISSSKGVTGTGIVMIFLGIISTICSALLGVFKDETKKKLKKSS